MNVPFKKLTLLATIIALQFPANLSGDESSFVTRSIKLYSWQQSIRDLYVMEGEGPRPVLIPNGAPTDAFTYTGNAQIRFGVLVESEDPAEDEPIFQTLVSTILPPTNEDILLIFLQNGNDDQYSIMPIVDDSNRFEKGSIRFINLSGTSLIVRMGNQNVNLENGDQKIVTPELNGGRNVTVLMASESEEGWQRAHSGRWGILPEKRTTVFLLPGAEANNVSFRRIVE